MGNRHGKQRHDGIQRSADGEHVAAEPAAVQPVLQNAMIAVGGDETALGGADIAARDTLLKSEPQKL